MDNFLYIAPGAEYIPVHPRDFEAASKWVDGPYYKGLPLVALGTVWAYKQSLAV